MTGLRNAFEMIMAIIIELNGIASGISSISHPEPAVLAWRPLPAAHASGLLSGRVCLPAQGSPHRLKQPVHLTLGRITGASHPHQAIAGMPEFFDHLARVEIAVRGKYSLIRQRLRNRYHAQVLFRIQSQ